MSSAESSDSQHDEVAATPALLRHISDHLGLPPGTHVVDVHGVKSVFTLHTRSAHTRSSGSTDGCICDTAHVGLEKRSAVWAAICLIELKTPEALDVYAEKCTTQAILELLGASMLCGYPVPVILTSLLEPSGNVPGIRVFFQEGAAVREFTGAMSGPLTLAEARGILDVLLPATLAARKKYLSAALATVPEVTGDDNHDDDDIVGDDDDAGDDEDYVPGRFRGGAVEASGRVLRGSRFGGAASSLPTSAPQEHCADAPDSPNSFCHRPASSLANCALYAELDEEVRMQSMQALIRRSPQIMQLLQCNTAIQ
jgi:hypothetical protein